MRSKVLYLPVVALLLLFAIALTPVAGASPSCENRNNNNHQKLLECVTVDGVREHQAAFQAFADANGGTRASGTPGFNASVDYVVERTTAAGYNVTVQPFEFPFFSETSIMEQISPIATVYADQVDYDLMTFSGEGDVTATLTAVNLSLGDPTAPTSGCAAADFAGFPVGNIAFMQRGTCSFAIKAANAEAAGAVGVIVMNQGTSDRLGLLFGTLGGPGSTIPVFGTTFALGQELASLVETNTLIMHLSADVISETRTTYNVFAETPGGRADNVVVVGSHLDSVTRGPGIQDNGSGSAAILEVAEQMHKVNPVNKVRFAWWGAEEFNLLGSEHYVENLSEEALNNIALYLNFDMIGSPNYVFFIYDGDDSDGVGAGPGPEGSAQIEALFETYYNSVGQPYKGTDFSGRSDYGPFIAAGIPAGGLFTGAEGIKTPAEVAIWGGTAGAQYDPCYHLACDTYDNISLTALDVNADAVAYSTLQYAMNTETVNNVSGKGNFKHNNGADHAHDHDTAQ